ncbi:SIR2 family protein [Cryobacterium frigoriphilum]|uniref:SIR2 family protein n=1 Tax=Cryobacterium frigoriphilum TaxID=1259150 RepID=UPI0018E0B495|nr:SIR2 family protein [Cryobacterium frigoriphilum]
MATLQSRILSRLEGSQLIAFKRITSTRNLEQALTRLRRIQAVVEVDDVVDGLNGAQAIDLDASICRIIIDELTNVKADLEPVGRLAAWVARADYAKPVELFTVNYDTLLEQALESQGVPYFDGFIGTLKARFRTDMVEATSDDSDVWLPSFYARLWKLHGSVNWTWDTDASISQVLRLGSVIPAGALAAIFPSDAKYEESRRMPFVVLQDRMRRALNEPETLFLVSGYAWADEHLNELIFDAVARRPRSEVVAFCFAEIPPSLAEKALTAPNLQVITQQEAIIGGIRAPWSGPEKETTLPADIWENNRCNLGDFAALTTFLARSSSGPALVHSGGVSIEN